MIKIRHTSLLVSLFSLNALAAEAPAQNFEPHFYLGGKLGWGNALDTCSSDVNNCSNDALGGGVFMGYQFMSWFAIEADATHYGNYEGRYDGGTISNDIRALGLSAVLQQYD